MRSRRSAAATTLAPTSITANAGQALSVLLLIRFVSRRIFRALRNTIYTQIKFFRVSKIAVFCFCECKIVLCKFQNNVFSLSLSPSIFFSLYLSLSFSLSRSLSLSLARSLSRSLLSFSLHQLSSCFITSSPCRRRAASCLSNS